MSTPPDHPTSASGGAAAGVIHDIGYRHYDGPRLGSGYTQRSLFVESLRGAYGLGRSMRSKVMPVLLLVAICLPALIIVIVTAMTGGEEIPVQYSSYPFQLQVVVSIYLAAQAPAMVSRDLRYKVMSLYLARPLRRAQYVQAKLAAMATAVLLLLALPLTILFVGGLLAKLSFTDQAPEYLLGMVGAALYAVVLGGIALLVAALTPRRGLGVAAVIAVLTVLAGVQAMVMAIASEFGDSSFAAYSGLISPYSLVDGVLSGVLATESTVGLEPPGFLGAATFAVATVLVVAGCYAGLLARYRRVPVS